MIHSDNVHGHDRIRHLLSLLPRNRSCILDIGSRDGSITRRLTEYFDSVTALDLQKPSFAIKNVIPVAGNITHLKFPDSSFDVVLCAEVLEHVEPRLLQQACDEITRVGRHEVIIGVPYKQDIRLGRTTCRSCGGKNPPYGHLNSFDEARLKALFGALEPIHLSLLGRPAWKTNALSVFLNDLAGNPWGTYGQEEPCVHCGTRLVLPEIHLMQRMLARKAIIINAIQNTAIRHSPYWMHVVFKK